MGNQGFDPSDLIYLPTKPFQYATKICLHPTVLGFCINNKGSDIAEKWKVRKLVWPNIMRQFEECWVVARNEKKSDNNYKCNSILVIQNEDVGLAHFNSSFCWFADSILLSMSEMDTDGFIFLTLISFWIPGESGKKYPFRTRKEFLHETVGAEW